NVKPEDIFKLDKSYRSPNTVLKVAHQLILNNDKDSFLVENAEGRDGDKVEVIELKHGDEEARKIAELIEEEIEKGTPMDQICVLFRTHKQGSMIKQAIESKGIPVVSAGKVDLMQKPEIRTIIAYLSILNNLRERTGTGEQSWWDLFHYHNALSPEDSVKIGRYIKKNRNDEMSIDLAILHNLEDLDLSANGKQIVKRIYDKLSELIKISNKALPDLILDLFEIIGLNRAFSHTRSIKNVEAMMNLKNFYDIAESYYKTHSKDLTSFISYIEILDDLGVNVDASKINDVNAVRLMTIHAVKGLQFDTVIVTNLADNRFPITRTRNEPLIPKEFLPDLKEYLDSLGELDDKKMDNAIKEYERDQMLYEERRLCYVAFTRAKKKLVLTFARSYNKDEDSTGASIFMTEIESEDISYIKDDEDKCTLFAPCSKFELFKSQLKGQLIESLDSDDFENLLSRLITYHAVREGEIKDYTYDWKKVVDVKELEKHVKMHCDKCSCLTFDPKSFTFSPTALMTYDECPKKYELSQIFQMPQRGSFGWSGASTGSFVHELFENGVKQMFKTKEEFVKLAVEMSKVTDWKGVDLEDVNQLIDVFWSRHEGTYNKKSLVEQKFPFEIEGFKFFGLADRIDFVNDKDVIVIDYKSNKKPIEPKKRAWQLGFYAIGAKEVLGLNPVKLSLEMLRLDKPFETDIKDGKFTAGSRGNYKEISLDDVKKELVDCAKKIVKDYETKHLLT
ncbi:3'-5' exonuclease, partial [Nanoarchaeota archaeon]